MFHLPITIISARPILVAQTILKMHCPLHQKTSFHKRPLPNILIAFSSPEGKQIFKESLNEGNLENFFPLIEQFHSQTDPACKLFIKNIHFQRLWPWIIIHGVEHFKH